MRSNHGETLNPPRRVEILRVEDPRPSSYFKVGQFGYARVRHTRGGFATQDAGESAPGQTVYAVFKAKDGRGGAVWFTEDGIRFTGRGTEGRHRAVGARQGRPVVKRGVRGIYEVLWYDTGAGEVRSLVNRTVVAEYTPGLGWEDHGRLPDDVREYAQQIASGVAPHHRPKSQPMSHAQIKREVDEILAGRHDGTSSGKALPKRQIPGIAAWNMFAGGTAAAPGKHGYSLHLPEGEYHVSPVSSQHGRHRGYSLMFAARQQPRGSHGGLWHDLGMHRSPAKAAVAARKHYAASY
jgi:hypothetical protein